MIVAVSIPLVDRGNELNLYRVHNLPLKVRNGYSVTADIDTEYLLIGRNGEYNLAIEKEDFQVELSTIFRETFTIFKEGSY